MDKLMIYRLDPRARYLSEEEKRRLREAQTHGYGVMMPGQWAEKLMNEVDDLKAINEELRRAAALREEDAGHLSLSRGGLPEEAPVLQVQGDTEPV